MFMNEQIEQADWLEYRYGSWKGMVRQGWEETLQKPEKFCQLGESVIDKADRSVRRWESPLGNVYVKRIYSPQAPSARLLTYGKNLLRPPRSLQVWRVCEALLEAGLRCPKPLLAAYDYRLHALASEELMVAAELPYPLFSKKIRESDLAAEFKSLLQAAGKGIRKLHDKGFVHGDCIPGNMCIDQENNLYFLDNDRTARLSLLGARQARLRNLVQFSSRTLPLLPESKLMHEFIQAYYLTDQRQSDVVKQEQQKFKQMLELRLEQLELELGRKLPRLK